LRVRERYDIIENDRAPPPKPCYQERTDGSGMTISAKSASRSMPVMKSSITHSWAPTRTRQITAGSWTDARADPGHLFPRHFAGPLSAHHRNFHRGVAPGAITGSACPRGDRGASVQAGLPGAPERRYALREVKARLHQASFRDAVLTALRRSLCDFRVTRAAST
jgi:hypothetical protein